MAKSKIKSPDSKTSVNGNGAVENTSNDVRLAVQKTYKLYIGGKFPRTESGRYLEVKDKQGKLIANYCHASRKDFRNAVQCARNAFAAWAGRTAYNRGQILYRIAEVLEGRKVQFIEELILQGENKVNAEKEVAAAIDRCVYYAGWADKYQQIFSAVNPVSSSHFNFSILEPMGVMVAFAPESHGLLGLVSIIAPLIAGGNSCIVLASESKPLAAISFAEVLQASDVPGGVVNLLTGIREELLPHFIGHMDVNGMLYCEGNTEIIREMREKATLNVKRTIFKQVENWFGEPAENPYWILDAQETKTTWHPIGK